MPEPVAGATYRLFSWLRQGLLAGITNSASASTPPTAGRLVVPIRLRVNNARDVDVPVELYGPGDVTGLDAREVIRTEPPARMTDFEPNYFPLIEFDRPDFCWLFTPALPDGDRRLRPWIYLVVVRKEGASIAASPNRPLPVLTCSRQELPDLEQSWAWAHAQIVSSGANVPDPPQHAALSQILEQQPERTLSRLLGPRRLDPGTAYYACLVPAYEVGRKVGLGQSTTPEEEQALKPAWTADSDDPVELPVYLHWEFATGRAGDFESLARRLEPRPLPSTVGLRPLDISAPSWGMPTLDPEAPGGVLDLEGALRAPETSPRPWPEAAQTAFQQALRAILDLPATQAASSDGAAVLGPPLYGQWYAKQQTVPAGTGAPHWFRELNLDPRLRVAAGLGTLMIRYEQEQLMASAWDQLARHEADNQRRKRAQLAEAVGDALVKKHLAVLAPGELLRVTGPAHAAIDRLTATRSLTAQPSRLPIGHPGLSGAFRRLSRPRGPIARRLDRSRANDARGGVTARVAQPSTVTPPSTVDPLVASLLARRTEPVPAASELQTMRATVLTRLDPRLTVLAAVRETAPSTESTDLIRFAPTFPQPMYELLRDYAEGMLLPGMDQVPPNTIALLETNQRFIEAYMVGLNHEMSHELLWRGYPTDQRGTSFRQFWDVRGGRQPASEEEREKLRDITAIATWVDNSHLGEHAGQGAAEDHMVLLIRGDLLLRYPRAMIYAVEAVWSADGTRRELGTTELYPMFRATQPPDITMLGFLLTEAQVRGADDSTNGGHSGWFFVLQEQPTEPRFGLDVATTFGGTPQHWRDLSWGHLAPDEQTLERMVYVPIDGVLANTVLDGIPWGKNSAHMASITRQRPFRVAIHARTWLPAPR